MALLLGLIGRRRDRRCSCMSERWYWSCRYAPPRKQGDGGNVAYNEAVGMSTAELVTALRTCSARSSSPTSVE